MSEEMSFLIMYSASILLAFVGLRYHYWKEKEEHAEWSALAACFFPVINTLVGCALCWEMIEDCITKYNQKHTVDGYRQTVVDKIFGVKRRK